MTDDITQTTQTIRGIKCNKCGAYFIPTNEGKMPNHKCESQTTLWGVTDSEGDVVYVTMQKQFAELEASDRSWKTVIKLEAKVVNHD